MIKHLINREDRNILQDYIVNFPKKRTYRNEGRKQYNLTLPPNEDIKVRFESRFENGNLWKAIKVTDTEYNLVLCYDFNTSGHTQWYYFRIQSKLKAGTKIKFNIVNLMKPDSLSNEGMKPCVKSLKHYQEKGVGWHRDCENISYQMNKKLRNRDRKPDEDGCTNLPLWTYYYFTLSFTYKQLYDNDTVFFAHAVPYTYSYNLIPFLDSIARNKEYKSEFSPSTKNPVNSTETTSESGEGNKPTDYSKFLRIGTLCKTLASNH